MYEIDHLISETTYDGLSVQKLSKTESTETLLITLEKDCDFPEHTSPRDALLVMMEGEIKFNIQNKQYKLSSWETFKFSANERHNVHSISSSKFLIIR